MSGKFMGIGVGPGDPELITLKAARLIGQADVISFIANEKGESQAKAIANDVLSNLPFVPEEIPIVMPMCEDRRIANDVYDAAALSIQSSLSSGKNVVFLCEGDPLFFGSFAYLLERLQPDNHCEVVPGISSVHAASATLQIPLTVLKESLAVISGRHSLQYLTDTLISKDSVVIMKAGRSREKIMTALEKSNRIKDAKYLEYIGRENQIIEHDVVGLNSEAGPYFSLFVVTRQERNTG